VGVCISRGLLFPRGSPARLQTCTSLLRTITTENLVGECIEDVAPATSLLSIRIRSESIANHPQAIVAGGCALGFFDNLDSKPVAMGNARLLPRVESVYCPTILSHSGALC
jgi:hypothetical protein